MAKVKAKKESLIANYWYYVLVGLLMILLTQNWHLVLWNADEAAYAGFALNMAESGQWLIPDFMWSDVHRKVPLHFWLVAASYEVFGFSEFVTRLSSSIFVFGTYLLIYYQGRHWLGKEVALVATLIAGTSFLMTALGKIAMTDGTLLFFETLAAFSILHVLESKSLKWVITFWVSIAMGILVKGPPILIFTFILVGLLFILHPKRKNLYKLAPWFGLPLALIPLGLWCLMVYREDPSFLQWLVDWYILKRVDGSVFGQTGPPGYYLVTLLISFLPFFIFIPALFWKTFTGMRKKLPSFMLFGSWFVAGWFIYELIPSKLPAYAIAAHPAFSILIAVLINKSTKELSRKYFRITSIIQLIIGCGLLTFLLIYGMNGLPTRTIISLFTLIFAFIVTTVIFMLQIEANKFKAARNSLLLGAFAFSLLAWSFVLPQFQGALTGTKEISAYLAKNAVSESNVYIGNRTANLPSLPFYISNRFGNVAEMYDLEKVVQTYGSPEPSVFVLTKELLDQLSERAEFVESEHFSSFNLDHRENENYYIVINPSAKR